LRISRALSGAAVAAHPQRVDLQAHPRPVGSGEASLTLDDLQTAARGDELSGDCGGDRPSSVGRPSSCSIYSIDVYYSNNGARSMTEYSTSDLSRKSGDIIAEALRRPVTITQRNKPRLVLLSIEDYRRLIAKADTRKAGRLETMPDDLFEDLKEAVIGYEEEGDET
jgi:prevent-host-death family protein